MGKNKKLRYYSGLIFWTATAFALLGVLLFLYTQSSWLMIRVTGSALLVCTVSGFIWCGAKMFEPPIGQPRPEPEKPTFQE